MACSACGTELPEGAVFCPKCGHRQPVAPSDSFADQRSNTSSEQQAGNVHTELMRRMYGQNPSIAGGSAPTAPTVRHSLWTPTVPIEDSGPQIRRVKPLIAIISIGVLILLALAVAHFGFGGEAKSADTSRQVADGFLKQATAGDLSGAAQYLAPDHQPKGWEDVFNDSVQVLGQQGDGNVGWSYLNPDFSACRHVPHHVLTERSGNLNGVSFAEITYAFDSACVVHPSPIAGGSIADTENASKVVVDLDNSTGRWYVTKAEVDA